MDNINTKNYGRLAYSETENLKRKVMENDKRYSNLIKTFYIENFTINNLTLLKEINLVSDLGDMLNVSGYIDVNQECEIIFYCNNIMVYNTKLNSGNNFYNFNIKSMKNTEIKVYINSMNSTMLNKGKIEISGNYSTERVFSYNNIIVDKNNFTNEYYVFVKVGELCKLFKYLSKEDFLQNFNIANTNYTTIDNFRGYIFSKRRDGTTVYDDEMFVLSKNNTSGKIEIKNITATKMVEVDFDSGCKYAIVSNYSSTGKISLITLKNKNVKIFIYNNNLVKLDEVEGGVDFKQEIKEIIAIQKKDGVYLNNYSFLVKTTGDEIFIVYVVDMGYYNYVHNIPKKLIGNVDSFYAYSKGDVLTILSENKTSIYLSEFEIKENVLYTKKILHHEVLNIELYFNYDYDFYLYNHKFMELLYD